MNHGKIKAWIAVTVLACVSTAGLVVAQNARNPLAQQYPELFGTKAKATIVSFSATW